MPTANIGDVELYYSREGKGAPILFIAGLSAGQQLWDPLVKHLTDRYECITFDNRGVGQSSKPDTGYTMPDLSRDALGLLDSLGIPRTHVIGMSMGGLIAMDMAVKRPEAIASLVLLGTFGKTSPRGDLVQEVRKTLQARLEPHEYFMVLATWMFGPESLGKPGFVEEFVRMQVNNPHPQAPHAFRQLAEGVKNFDMRAKLKDIRQPTLVLVGEEDVMATPSQSRSLAQGIPGAELMILPNLGHFLLMEDPQLLADRICGFLDHMDPIL